MATSVERMVREPKLCPTRQLGRKLYRRRRMTVEPNTSSRQAAPRDCLLFPSVRINVLLVQYADKWASRHCNRRWSGTARQMFCEHTSTAPHPHAVNAHSHILLRIIGFRLLVVYMSLIRTRLDILYIDKWYSQAALHQIVTLAQSCFDPSHLDATIPRLWSKSMCIPWPEILQLCHGAYPMNFVAITDRQRVVFMKPSNLLFKSADTTKTIRSHLVLQLQFSSSKILISKYLG